MSNKYRILDRVLQKTRGVIKKFFKSRGYHKENEVLVEKKYPLDRYLINGGEENKEGGIVNSHVKLTKTKDKVTIIGGGSGVTAVRAARLVGKKGRVKIYEGGKESIDKIKKVIEINGVSEICKVSQAIVGTGKHVYGGGVESATHVSPSKLRPCDVLELDCEGSELCIVKKLSFTPRVIICELHPWLMNESVDLFFNILSEKGYNIEYCYGHDGLLLDQKEYEKLLKYSKKHSRRYVESGARWPVVIAATTST